MLMTMIEWIGYVIVIIASPFVWGLLVYLTFKMATLGYMAALHQFYHTHNQQSQIVFVEHQKEESDESEDARESGTPGRVRESMGDGARQRQQW